MSQNGHNIESEELSGGICKTGLFGGKIKTLMKISFQYVYRAFVLVAGNHCIGIDQ